MRTWNELGAVSAHHLVHRPRSLLTRLQQLEMERGRRTTAGHYGRHTCMSGMASMFRAGGLREVIQQHRGTQGSGIYVHDFRPIIREGIGRLGPSSHAPVRFREDLRSRMPLPAETGATGAYAAGALRASS